MPLNTSVVDTFNRSQGTFPNYLGFDWTPGTGGFVVHDPLQIDSNHLVAFYNCESVYTALTLDTDDGHLEVAYTVLSVPTTAGEMRLGVLSIDNANSGYEALWAVDTGVMTLYRVDAGTRTSLGTASSVSWTNGDLYIVRRLATGHVTVSQDHSGVETPLIDATESTYTGTFYGVIGVRDDAGTVTKTWGGDSFAAGAYNPDQINFTTRLSGGSSNTDPALSLGGTESSAAAAGSTLLSDETNAERLAGRTRYRCIYRHNEDGSRSADVLVWISASDIPSGVTLAIGAAVEGAGEEAAAIANETTAPTSVVFTAPTIVDDAISLGTPAPGESTGLWVREVLGADAVDIPTGEQADVTATIKFRATPV